jgi:hypothetical protein
MGDVGKQNQKTLVERYETPKDSNDKVKDLRTPAESNLASEPHHPERTSIDDKIRATQHITLPTQG